METGAWWRCEQSSGLVKEQQPKSAAIKERVVGSSLAAVVRAGADVDEAHLQRVMRTVRSA